MKQQGRVKLWLLLAAGSGDLIHSKHLDHSGPRTLTQGFLFQIFSLLNSGYKVILVHVAKPHSKM